MLDPPFIVGHRGAARHAPENTLAGFRAAHALGARWVEFDVQAAHDGEAFLMHDARLDRTTDGHGSAARRTMAELARLDAGAWFGAAFRGEPVPRLDEALALVAALGMGAIVELKPAPGHGARTLRAALPALEAWPATLPPPILSSFDETALAAAQEAAPALPRALIVKDVPADWRARIQRLGCSALHAAAGRLASPSAAAAARTLPVRAYTVNQPEQAKSLFQQGIAAVFSDCPDVLISAIGHQAAAPTTVGGAGGEELQ